MKNNYRFFKKSYKLLEESMNGISNRVPVYAQIHEFAMKEMGLTPDNFYNNPKNLILALLETHKKYRLDAPCVDYDVYNIEAEGIGQRIIYKPDAMPDVDRRDYLIKGSDDLKKIKKPNFNSDSSRRFRFVIEALEYFYELTGVYSPLNFCAPFSLAANIRGIEFLLFDIMERPNFARELLKRVTEEVIIPWILYQSDIFPDSPSIVGSDATASLPIINIEMLEDWVLPYIVQIRDVCGNKVYVSNWVGDRYLKNPERIFEDKLKVCPGFLEGQDPDVEALGPEIYKNFAEERNVALVLGVGAAFLATATPDEVKNRVKRYVSVGSRNGKFALYLCNIGKTTPKENLVAAVDAVYEFFTNK